LGAKLHTRNKSFFVSLLLAAAVVALCGFWGVNSQQPVNLSAAEIPVSIPNYDSFTSSETGIFIKKSQAPSPDNKIRGSISAAKIPNSGVNFNAEYSALKKTDDVWEDADSAYFEIVPSADNTSLIWYLRENAPTADYAVVCTYYGQEYLYHILYTDEWTFVNVTNSSGNNTVKKFYGGSVRILTLFIYYNPGASVGVLQSGTLSNGSAVGGLMPEQIVGTENLTVSCKTLSGEKYDSIVRDTSTSANMIRLRFDEELGNDTYIVKITDSNDGQVYGTFVIDNTEYAPINLSTDWVGFIILGGFLLLLGAAAYFLPHITRNINANRVERESEQIARMKNPNQYGDKPESFLTRLFSKFKKKKTGETADADKPKAEPGLAGGRGKRFTDVLQGNIEKRQFAEEANISFDVLEKIEKEEEDLKQAEQDSFAFLRDTSSPIATLKKEEEKDRSIEADAVRDESGVVFSALDSLKDEPAQPGQPPFTPSPAPPFAPAAAQQEAQPYTPTPPFTPALPDTPPPDANE
jgi:hypothetical protein